MVQMTKSIYSKEYEVFRHMIIEARKKVRVTQKELAQAMNRPQSFISKCEQGERRLDIVEFMQLAEALSIDMFHFLAELKARMEQKHAD
jgi:ribosome-binding protein aMBF1 (putative translation factor)